jgi:hypothetical protein
MKFNRNKNKITFPKNLHLEDIDEAIAALHDAIVEKCYSDLILDFKNTRVAAPEFMLALCDVAYEYRASSNIDFDVLLPTELKKARLFKNTNWAYYLSPNNYQQSNYKGSGQVPATLYETPAEQHSAVNNIVRVLLQSLTSVQRGDFAAFEWAINEITDNVLVHANPKRGFVQVSKFHKKSNKISFVVCDSGSGIPSTLRGSMTSITSDTEALAESIKEGITRDKRIGQGNGLFGSFQVCTGSGGVFRIRSGYAFLDAKGSNLTTTSTKVPYRGTIIVSEVDFSTPNLLEKALKFNNKIYSAPSRIESIYEDDNDDIIIVKIKDEAESYGSRMAGTPINQMIINFMKMHPAHKIHIDFTGITIISSSFADEICGKLCSNIGPDEYLKKIRISNATQLIESIINKVIDQRLRTDMKA